MEMDECVVKRKQRKQWLDYAPSHSVLPFIPAFTFCHSFHCILWLLKF